VYGQSKHRTASKGRGGGGKKKSRSHQRWWPIGSLVRRFANPERGGGSFKEVGDNLNENTPGWNKVIGRNIIVGESGASLLFGG